ncbi:MAG: hypothetical protein M1814_002557 [Vezdaea aestivalis]|nr:MAG: hypothetical protein M1814_002557 [Vezdaea aestivalis]
MLHILSLWAILCMGLGNAVGRMPPRTSPSLTQDSVTIINSSTGAQIACLPAENVYELGFSPNGTYIITWQRPSKEEDGSATKNLKVWKVLEGSEIAFQERLPLGKFVQKSQTGWNLQYTSDERYCARTVTNEVQFYMSGDLNTVWNKLRVEGVADFALSPGSTQSVAVFVPERKSQPAAVKVFNIPQFSEPVSQKNFYKGDKVQLKWNDMGTSIIVLAQTEVDKTGKSYYGETNLYLLSASGGFDSRITLDKEGPIHDVSWSPNSKEFGVVYGSMPAKTTIFNSRAVALHNFPLGPRNTILFSPLGRFVLVAGFGNLAGQIDIYDLEKNYQKITTIESGNPSVCEWCPDGQYILTATTSPRLRVDNGVRIWHASGGLMYVEDLNELYHVTWRPLPSGTNAPSIVLNPAPTAHSSALTYLGTVKTPSKPAGAYRPPGARGQATPLHFKREDEGGAAHISDGISSFSSRINGFGKRREVPGAETVDPSLPPGAAPGGGVSLTLTGEAGDEPLSKAALKNKKKREAKRARDAEKGLTVPDGAAGTGVAPNGHGGDRPRPRSRTRSRSNTTSNINPDPGPRAAPRKRSQQRGSPAKTTPQPQTVPAPEVVEPAAPASPPAGGSPQEKKLRGLHKKLRAIEDLKMRHAGGEKLEDTQLKKIMTEDSVRKDLEALGYQE